MIGLTYLIFFISIVGFSIVALLTFIQYLKRFKTDLDTQNRKMKKLSRLLLVFAIALIVTPIVGTILTSKENSEKNTKTTENKEEHKKPKVTTEEPTTEEVNTEETTTEEPTTEVPTTEEVKEVADDDKTPEQLQEKIEGLLDEHLFDGTATDVQFFKDSLGSNLMIEVEPISTASEDTIKDILVQAFQAVSYTDAEYDSVQVSVVEDGNFIGKAKLGNDGIYSIRNKENETDFDNLEMFAEEEITIEPN